MSFKDLKENSEKGALMVEASLYVPIVIMMVIFMIYIALFNMQEYVMMYEAQRVSSIVARQQAYLGYNELGVGENDLIDFKDAPDESEKKAYYNAKINDLGSLYREVGRLFATLGGTGVDTSSMESRFSQDLKDAAIVTIGTISSPEIDIKTGLFGSGITVTFTHRIPVPGAFKYLGFSGRTDLRVAAYTYSVNPGEFARNVNLACDIVDYVAEKLGLSNGLNDIKNGLDKILNMVL